jgi:short-subunit dehydrogenase
MIARGHGAIINVSSLAAFVPGPYDATYGATKAFVNSFTEALHEELRGTGVRVQALCPGFTHTEFQQRAGIDVSRIPAFAWMTPEAVVEASLAALQRGQVVCVPGLVNRLLAMLIGAAPRRLVRRVTGLLAHRVLGR